MRMNMNKKREFGGGLIFNISNYLFWFLLGNIYFWMMNIPYLFVSLTMSLSGNVDVNVILILSLIPMGPALTALLSVMGKLIREGDINLTKDFFKAYKESLFDSLFFWTLGLIILFVIKIDGILIGGNPHLHFLSIFTTITSYICIALSFYIFPIISRFHLKKMNIVRLSFDYLIKRVYICVIAFIVIYLLWTISSKSFQAIIVLFSVSIVTYIIMYLQKGVLKEIEDRLNNKNKSKLSKENN